MPSFEKKPRDTKASNQQLRSMSVMEFSAANPAPVTVPVAHIPAPQCFYQPAPQVYNQPALHVYTQPAPQMMPALAQLPNYQPGANMIRPGQQYVNPYSAIANPIHVQQLLGRFQPLEQQFGFLEPQNQAQQTNFQQQQFVVNQHRVHNASARALGQYTGVPLDAWQPNNFGEPAGAAAPMQMFAQLPVNFGQAASTQRSNKAAEPRATPRKPKRVVVDLTSDNESTASSPAKKRKTKKAPRPRTPEPPRRQLTLGQQVLHNEEVDKGNKVLARHLGRKPSWMDGLATPPPSARVAPVRAPVIDANSSYNNNDAIAEASSDVVDQDAIYQAEGEAELKRLMAELFAED